MLRAILIMLILDTPAQASDTPAAPETSAQAEDNGSAPAAGTAPTEDDTAPTEDDTAPTDDSTPPTEDGTAPTEDGTPPTEDGTPPAEDSEPPVEADPPPAPVEAAPAPAEPSPAPSAGATVPALPTRSAKFKYGEYLYENGQTWNRRGLIWQGVGLGILGTAVGTLVAMELSSTDSVMSGGALLEVGGYAILGVAAPVYLLGQVWVTLGIARTHRGLVVMGSDVGFGGPVCAYGSLALNLIYGLSAIASPVCSVAYRTKYRQMYEELVYTDDAATYSLPTRQLTLSVRPMMWQDNQGLMLTGTF